MSNRRQKTQELLMQINSNIDGVIDRRINARALPIHQAQATLAVAAATLCLAEQQHTANLIAWCSHSNSADLRREIQKRLGL